jgi:Leucine-rich repeat (LRR) protein
MSKALTTELIVMKTKNNHVHTIQKLNLWGHDINDISVCRDMPALEVLSLAVNNIFTLKDLQGCNNLKELYLRKN